MDKLHFITVENKNKFTASEVLEVLAFSEKEVKLKLTDKTTVTVLGFNLKIIGFDNQSGKIALTGEVFQIKYKGKEESFLNKVFK